MRTRKIRQAELFDETLSAIQVGDAQCGQAELIGKEYEALVVVESMYLMQRSGTGNPLCE